MRRARIATRTKPPEEPDAEANGSLAEGRRKRHRLGELRRWKCRTRGTVYWLLVREDVHLATDTWLKVVGVKAHVDELVNVCLGAEVHVLFAFDGRDKGPVVVHRTTTRRADPDRHLLASHDGVVILGRGPDGGLLPRCWGARVSTCPS